MATANYGSLGAVPTFSVSEDDPLYYLKRDACENCITRRNLDLAGIAIESPSGLEEILKAVLGITDESGNIIGSKVDGITNLSINIETLQDSVEDWTVS